MERRWFCYFLQYSIVVPVVLSILCLYKISRRIRLVLEIITYHGSQQARQSRSDCCSNASHDGCLHGCSHQREKRPTLKPINSIQSGGNVVLQDCSQFPLLPFCHSHLTDPSKRTLSAITSDMWCEGGRAFHGLTRIFITWSKCNCQHDVIHVKLEVLWINPCLNTGYIKNTGISSG